MPLCFDVLHNRHNAGVSLLTLHRILAKLSLRCFPCSQKGAGSRAWLGQSSEQTPGGKPYTKLPSPPSRSLCTLCCCRGKHTWVDISKEGYWQFAMDKIAFHPDLGLEACKHGCQAIADTGVCFFVLLLAHGLLSKKNCVFLTSKETAQQAVRRLRTQVHFACCRLAA